MITKMLLCPRNCEKSSIVQMIDQDRELMEGEEFEYGSYYYSELTQETANLFLCSGLEMGTYKVLTVYKNEEPLCNIAVLQLI